MTDRETAYALRRAVRALKHIKAGAHRGMRTDTPTVTWDDALLALNGLAGKYEALADKAIMHDDPECVCYAPVAA